MLKETIPREEQDGQRKTASGCSKEHQEAVAASKNKRTIAHLPKKTRTALGKQANKVKRQKAGKKS